MRQRLTISFVVLTLVLILGALWVRGYTAETRLRSHESSELRHELATLALLVEQRQELERPVDQAWLTGLIEATDRLEYLHLDGTRIRAEGEDFEGTDLGDALVATLDLDDGTLTLWQSDSVVDGLATSDRGSLGFLVLLVGLLAAAVGYVMARWLSGPFRQLAGAAGQLGRGRFDLDLPRTQIPEARAISQALLTSAGQLQERLASEQAFAEHASHVLRTPLTGLRLELEDLAQRPEVSSEVREAASRCIGRIEAMDAVAGDLVALARRGVLVAGAEIPLHDLATQAAQVWADALAEQDRALTAAVEGDLEMTYTPGPVEHILDLLLTDVLRRGQGAVRMVFEADAEGHLRIDLSCAAEMRPTRDPNADLPITQARAVVTALGGRLTGDTPDKLTILLPRR